MLIQAGSSAWAIQVKHRECKNHSTASMHSMKGTNMQNASLSAKCRVPTAAAPLLLLLFTE